MNNDTNAGYALENNISQEESLARVTYNTLQRLSESRHYLVAYSGGLDSHVLLHTLATLRHHHPDIQVRAMHIHHGLNAQADHWASHCQSICCQLNIPLIIKRIRVDTTSGQSVEAAARTARYNALAKPLNEPEVLLTAHTKNDQAETVLLQLLRGAGPKGLSAMPLKKTFVHSLHLRPFLTFTREMIVDYAKQKKLKWIEDESNQQDQFDRNYLRHHVMPLLTQRWPAALHTLARSAQHCAATLEMMADQANADWVSTQGTQTHTLSISALQTLSRARRDNLLRHWISNQGGNTPSTSQLQQIEHNLLNCHSDANPLFVVGETALRRYRDDLFLMNGTGTDNRGREKHRRNSRQTRLNHPVQRSMLDPVVKPRDDETDDETLNYNSPLKQTLTLPPELQHLSHLTVRFRQGGERIQPTGSRHTQSLKKLFQQWGIPPWERSRIPLLFDDDQLIAVVGYCVAAGFEKKT